MSVSFDDRYKIFGLEGIFASILVVIGLVMVSLWSPIVAIVAMLVGFIVTNILGILFINWSYAITLIIIGGIAIYKLNRK